MPHSLPHAAPLVDAVWHADVPTARRFLAADPELARLQVYRENTLLFSAARVPSLQGHGDLAPAEEAREPERVELVDLLLAYGADVNARNQRKVTPLHMAARYGLARVAEALIRHGADLNARDTNRETPLYRAANLGHAGVVAVLLRAGADPTLADRRGQTPLDRATGKGFDAIVALLSPD
jgi:ankyrin repeat protein